MNPNQNTSPTGDDTGTDGLKFHLPEGQTPGEGLGTGQTGMKDFNSDDSSDKTTESDWNEATGEGEKSEQVSRRDQDNSTV